MNLYADLDRLGDEIAELSAHLDAATARLLALIRDFDARGGWNNGFRSCADWLSWRVGLAPGAAAMRRLRSTNIGSAACSAPPGCDHAPSHQKSSPLPASLVHDAPSSHENRGVESPAEGSVYESLR